MLGDRPLVDAVLKDFRNAPISDAEKALFALVEKINRDSTQIRRADIDEAKAAGWTDEAIYDVVMVCALFRFMNTFVDATGVHDMPAAAYATSGERIATHGYAPWLADGE